MKKTFLSALVALASLIAFNSCIKIVVDGYSYGISNLTQEQRRHVIHTRQPIDELACDSNIYVIDNKQFKKYIEQQDSCIVYEWMAYCHLNECTPLLFERYCDSLHYTPVLVLDCFCWADFEKFDATHTPRLFPDIQPYGTKRVYKYMDAFCQEITGSDKHLSDFWVFKRGQFQGFMDYEIEDGRIELKPVSENNP